MTGSSLFLAERSAQQIKRAVKSLFRRSGLEIKQYRELDELTQMHEALLVLGKLRSIDVHSEEYKFLDFCRNHMLRSKSQNLQDLFVQYELKEKRGGYFVEFGATNGVDLSNTFMLEKDYGWDGILAEPANCWHTALRENRSCALEFKCVWSQSGETLKFNEVDVAEYSTIEMYSDRDRYALERTHGKSYPVETISLLDMLRNRGAPAQIDFMSIDTEGSELKILSSFDFSRYDVKLLTVEHNHSADREKIFQLMSSNGYFRKFEQFSRQDDWYVRR